MVVHAFCREISDRVWLVIARAHQTHPNPRWTVTAQTLEGSLNHRRYRFHRRCRMCTGMQAHLFIWSWCTDFFAAGQPPSMRMAWNLCHAPPNKSTTRQRCTKAQKLHGTCKSNLSESRSPRIVVCCWVCRAVLVLQGRQHFAVRISSSKSARRREILTGVHLLERAQVLWFWRKVASAVSSKQWPGTARSNYFLWCNGLAACSCSVHMLISRVVVAVGCRKPMARNHLSCYSRGTLWTSVFWGAWETYSPTRFVDALWHKTHWFAHQ